MLFESNAMPDNSKNADVYLNLRQALPFIVYPFRSTG